MTFNRELLVLLGRKLLLLTCWAGRGVVRGLRWGGAREVAVVLREPLQEEEE